MHVLTSLTPQIIVAVFQKYSRSSDLPSGLIADLLNQFSSSRGYKLYPDVIPFFQMARDARQPSASPNPLSTTLIGVLSNSDSRIPSILSDLGLKVGSTRSGASCDDVPRELCHANDVEFVALSYDSGHEKPDVRAFGAAEELAGRLADGIEQRVHVGDDIEKDIKGASAAGWTGILLDRDEYSDKKDRCIRNLLELEREILQCRLR